MPTVRRDGRFRLFFYSNEGDPREPVHVHVEVGRGGGQAKFWLDPVRPAWNRGLSAAEMLEAARLVEQNSAAIEEAWDEHFG